MGTSGSYAGPKGTNPLLPPWADDGDSGAPQSATPQPPVPPDPAPDPNASPDTPDPPPLPPTSIPDIPWSIPKSSLSRAVNSGGSPRAALGRYVRASGGASAAALRARSGRRTFARTANFLGVASRSGLSGAARQALGLLRLVGRDVHTILLDLASRLAPVGATNEEATARSALLATFATFAEALVEQGGNIDSLDHLDAGSIKSVLRDFVTNYVAERFLQELDLRIHRGRISVEDASSVFRGVKETIRATVAVDFRGIDVTTFNWETPGGRELAERIFREAYSLIEDL